jgi:hypothetical protein
MAGSATKCVLYFSGLCGLLSGSRLGAPRVVLIDPEASGGPAHRPTLLVRGNPAVEGSPDWVVGHPDTEDMAGVWSLTGCHVSIASPEPLVLKTQQPTPGTIDWSDLNLLQDISEVSGVTDVAPESEWPQAALVRITGGTVQGVPPSTDTLENRRYNFVRRAGEERIWADDRPLALRFAVVAESMRVVIESGTQRRAVRLQRGQEAVIANSAFGPGADVRHDQAAYALLTGAQAPYERWPQDVPRPNHLHDPDACGSFRLFL